MLTFLLTEKTQPFPSFPPEKFRKNSFTMLIIWQPAVQGARQLTTFASCNRTQTLLSECAKYNSYSVCNKWSVSVRTGGSASWLVEGQGQLYFNDFHSLKLHLRNLCYYADNRDKWQNLKNRFFFWFHVSKGINCNYCGLKYGSSRRQCFRFVEFQIWLIDWYKNCGIRKYFAVTTPKLVVLQYRTKCIIR